MDLNKASNEEKVKLCYHFFLGGFAFLPFLWLLNFVWFFNEAFRKPSFEGQAMIKNYVLYSGIGIVFWTIILIGWNIYFQLNRPYLSWADDLSFVLLYGYA